MLNEILQSLIEKTGKYSITPRFLARIFRTVNDFPHHIEVEIVDHQLKVHGAHRLLEEGYIPFVFRYTCKRNRNHTHQIKCTKGPRRKGWHVYGKSERIQIDDEEMAEFQAPWYYNIYMSIPDALFRTKYYDHCPHWPYFVNIPYGHRSKVLHAGQSKHFRFAIAFAQPDAVDPRSGKFDMTKVITNFANFRVRVTLTKQPWSAVEFQFCL